MNTFFRSDFKKGLKRVLLFYLSGLLITLAFHFFIGWEYQFLPPRSIVVLLIMLVIALPWIALNILNLPRETHRPQCTGELIVHGIVLAIATIISRFTSI